ncbi:MAG: hypothetical protein D6732_28945 [Methanobacteriota archaeon]|nr:MAG: hypothetical protein D6732_28945 [Euryarchaeota archaeon]
MLTDLAHTYPEEDKRGKFLLDLGRYLQTLSEDDIVFATHAHCTDGMVAASMIRYAFPHAKIVPIGYWFLNDPLASSLKKIKYTGIIDLAPFNELPTEFWVDHHLSAMNNRINAKKIRFDVDGDSGSYQLLLSGFLPELPDYLIELAVLTRITDTASYTILPPYEPEESFTELLQYPFSYIDDLSKVELQIQRKAYLLDDAVATSFDFWEWQNLVNEFASSGFNAISNRLDKIKEIRDGRKVAFNMVKEMPISDFVAFIVPDEKYDVFAIRRYLLAKGPKAVVSLTEGHNGYRISLRRAKNLSPEFSSKIQLNQLAEQLNGGGHAAASGGFSKDLEYAIDTMRNWAEEKGLKFIQIDLRG